MVVSRDFFKELMDNFLANSNSFYKSSCRGVYHSFTLSEVPKMNKVLYSY